MSLVVSDRTRTPQSNIPLKVVLLRVVHRRQLLLGQFHVHIVASHGESAMTVAEQSLTQAARRDTEIRFSGEWRALCQAGVDGAGPLDPCL